MISAKERRQQLFQPITYAINYSDDSSTDEDSLPLIAITKPTQRQEHENETDDFGRHESFSGFLYAPFTIHTKLSYGGWHEGDSVQVMRSGGVFDKGWIIKEITDDEIVVTKEGKMAKNMQKDKADAWLKPDTDAKADDESKVDEDTFDVLPALPTFNKPKRKKVQNLTAPPRALQAVLRQRKLQKPETRRARSSSLDLTDRKLQHTTLSRPAGPRGRRKASKMRKTSRARVNEFPGIKVEHKIVTAEVVNDGASIDAHNGESDKKKKKKKRLANPLSEDELWIKCEKIVKGDDSLTEWTDVRSKLKRHVSREQWRDVKDTEVLKKVKKRCKQYWKTSQS